MLTVEKSEVFNFEGAFRGLRNPLDSWEKSDSKFTGFTGHEVIHMCELGEKDLDLAHRMIRGGTDESKFLRQIMVSIDITAPLYWWKEFDTYKVGTVANSCSTMHTIKNNPITRESFSFDNYEDCPAVEAFINSTVNACEYLRQKYKETEDKKYWRALIQLLPESWMQKRTVTLNYQNLRAMYFARRHHKLTEWHDFCDWILSLPYGEKLIAYEVKK